MCLFQNNILLSYTGHRWVYLMINCQVMIYASLQLQQSHLTTLIIRFNCSIHTKFNCLNLYCAHNVSLLNEMYFGMLFNAELCVAFILPSHINIHATKITPTLK